MDFRRWVADIPPRKTSQAAKSEEKRLFSQARYNDIPHFQLAYAPVPPELFKVHASV